jgi:hypothetical protein
MSPYRREVVAKCLGASCGSVWGYVGAFAHTPGVLPGKKISSMDRLFGPR